MILPLRLEWNPCYYLDTNAGEEVQRGDRVRVRFAGKYYNGVVYETGIRPEAGIKRIYPITSVEDLPRISSSELELWKFVSDYYLCTLGEVYKAAYPLGRISEEQTALTRRQKSEERERKISAQISAKVARIGERIASKTQKIASLNPERPKQQEKIRLLQAQIQELSSQLEGLQLKLHETTPENGSTSDTKNNGTILLTQLQSRAKEQIQKAFSSDKTVLLKGVTGSGKTEIYLSLALESLSRGKNVLYMVPEIALSLQLESRLKKVFGELLLTFHSGESFTHRRDVADAMHNGQYVVLGTRSALFLPHRELGLIIVDEEHDGSYKQSSPAPRYNGRDTAVYLGRLLGAPVILGSATPSLESLYNCKTGKYELVTLSQKYYGDIGTEKIEIIDTIAERRKRGMVGSFSRKLLGYIQDTLQRGEQVLLLRGRRSYSTFVQCEDCGALHKCPHCNVPLSYHKDKGKLLCHYCGYSEVYSATCPSCGGHTGLHGAGTQKIEEEISALFPNSRVGRLDGDSAASSQKVIESFARGDTDILIGTQIVSKGFDFEKLSLVAVIQSDSLLGQPDFRTDEKAFQLLQQLRGRAGRRGKRSLFVIQSSQPENPVYSKLSSEDSFMDEELEMRKEYFYPPYTKLVRLTLKDDDLSRLENFACALSGELASFFRTRPSVIPNGAPVNFSPPYPPLVDKVSDQYIREIRLSLKRDKNLSAVKAGLAEKIAELEKKWSWLGHISVDVDPI